MILAMVKTRFLIVTIIGLVLAGFSAVFGQYVGESSEILDERIGGMVRHQDCVENSDERPDENFVFFDCKWVEVPHGWIFENGRWQEDLSVQRLGPAPLPTCPRIDVCTCSGKYNYYNSTDQQCYSSPYMPDSYNELCGDFSQMKFDGWQFNAKYCDWNHLSDPYENDESMRLASEKVGLGGLGIDPEFDIVIIVVGITSGIGIVLGLLFYWRRK